MTPQLSIPHVSYLAILPELFMIAGALVLVLAASLLRRRPSATFNTAVAVVVSGGALVASVFLWYNVADHGSRTTMAGSIAVDGFSAFFLVLLSSAALLSALVADGYLRAERIRGPEYHVLAMLAVSGAMLMASATDLIAIFLGLEVLSIALYVLTGLDVRRGESREAAMKYFVLGAFSSAVFLYGIALVYGATGSTNLAEIAKFLTENALVSNGVLLAGTALVIVGFAFKIAAVPFHMWTPDVYQGAPTPVTAFMAAVAKAGGFAALLRVFYSSLFTLRADWQPIIWALAAASMVLGAIMAVVQRDVKRMLAYSSINHAGLILLGLEAATAKGMSGSLYYLFAYALLVIASFAVVNVVGGTKGNDLERYRGLASRQPVLAGAFALLLLAQAGVPFTAGFLAKFYVISAVIASGSYALAVVAMVSVVIAAFFYLRVVLVMFTPGTETAGVGAGAATASVGGGPSDVEGHGALTTESDMSGITAGRVDSAGAGAVAVLADGLGDSEPVGEDVVSVPIPTAFVIAASVGFTVFFGIIASPLVNFAHAATLLF